MTSTNTTKVAIVGGGLAGLACALHLKHAGIPFQLFESTSTLGGRVATDIVAGFRLDRGFQVLLTSYEEAQRTLPLDSLELRKFAPGAIIRHNGTFQKVADPFRNPQSALQTLASKVGTLSDKLLIAKLNLFNNDCAPDDRKNANVKTIDELHDIGFSDEFIDAFLRPFFGGIFLENQLESNAAMFRYLFKMFSTGYAALPASGMRAISAQLAAQLSPAHYRLGCPVQSINESGITLSSGEKIRASHTVIATDWRAAAKLLGRESLRESRSVTCLYFSAKEIPSNDPILYLNGDRDGIINNLCFPTTIAPTYAPAHQHLVSVTVLGSPTESDKELQATVHGELVRWFGDIAMSWQHLRTYRIKDALPDQSPSIRRDFQDHRLSDQLFICGDYTENASINGALLSGRRAAESLIKTVKSTAA